MKGIIKAVATVSIAILAAGNAAALDYGFELSNEFGLNHVSETKGFSDNRADAWITIPLDTTNTSSLEIEGKLYGAKPAPYSNIANTSDSSTSSKYTSYVNLELFRFSTVSFLKTGTRIAFDIGRIPSADITGYILNQAVDGIEFHGSFGFGNIDVLAAHTGLLNARKTGSLMTVDDYADMDTNKLYAFGAKRAIGKLTVQIPQIFKTIDLIAEGVGQLDMRRSFESDPTQTVNTGYGTLALNGQIIDKLFFSLAGTYQTGILKQDKYYSENSMLYVGRLDWFAVRNSKIFTEFLYTSEDNSYFSNFLPITYQNAGDLYLVGYTNIMRGTLGCMSNPLSFLNLDMTGRVFMYPKKPAAENGIFRSTEITGGATIQATSDLKVRLSGTVLFPKDEDTQYQTSLKAILDL